MITAIAYLSTFGVLGSYALSRLWDRPALFDWGNAIFFIPLTLINLAVGASWAAVINCTFGAIAVFSLWRSSTDVVETRPWERCSMVEDGLVCYGTGDVQFPDSFNINVNGEIVEVVVTSITTPGPEWQAIDREQFDRLYRIEEYAHV